MPSCSNVHGRLLRCPHHDATHGVEKYIAVECETGFGEFAGIGNVRREIEVKGRLVLKLRVEIAGRAVGDLDGGGGMHLSEIPFTSSSSANFRSAAAARLSSAARTLAPKRQRQITPMADFKRDRFIVLSNLDQIAG